MTRIKLCIIVRYLQFSTLIVFGTIMALLLALHIQTLLIITLLIVLVPSSCIIPFQRKAETLIVLLFFSDL